MESKVFTSSVFTSSAKAIRRAYTKAVAVYGLLGFGAFALYNAAQKIAESHVPGGIWNAETWAQEWPDGNKALTYLVSGVVMGAFTLFGGILKFDEVFERSNTRTELDLEGKKITQTTPRFYDSSGRLFEKKEEIYNFDFVTHAYLSQNPLERLADTGSVFVELARFEPDEDFKDKRNITLDTRWFTIPYQDNPRKILDELFEHVPNVDRLKEVVRGI